MSSLVRKVIACASGGGDEIVGAGIFTIAGEWVSWQGGLSEDEDDDSVRAVL
jgi:hypothetical protein